MSYGIDLRERVVDFVRRGGGKTEASIRFGVSRGRVYRWLALGDDLTTGLKPGPKTSRQVDIQQLATMVQQRPDILQKEVAQQFGVAASTICRILRKLRYSRKKNVGLQGVVAIPKAPQKISQMARPPEARRTKR